MKKLTNSFWACISLVLCVSSCTESAEEPVPVNRFQEISISASIADDLLPDSRYTPVAGEYGDGSLATVLDWGIYEKGSKIPFIKSGDSNAPKAVLTESGFRLNIALDVTKQYDILLFAHSSTQGRAPFTVNLTGYSENYRVTMNHHNDESPDRNDCFFAFEELSADNRAFSLRRPVAQLCVVTDEDLSKYDLSKLTTELKFVRAGTDEEFFVPEIDNQGINHIDPVKFGVENYTVQKASVHNGKTITYQGRRCRYLALDYIFEFVIEDGFDVLLTFKYNGATLSTKRVYMGKGLHYASRWVIMPPSGKSLIE